MKGVAYIALALSAVSLVIGFISKIKLTPVALLPGGLEAESLLLFTNTCLLIAIVCILLDKVGKK
jgi:hypothetical protein